MTTDADEDELELLEERRDTLQDGPRVHGG